MLCHFLSNLGLADGRQLQGCKPSGNVLFPAGMFNLRNAPDDPINGLHEPLPAATLRSQNLPPLRDEAVIASPALPALFHPSALSPAARFQRVRRSVSRSRSRAVAEPPRETVLKALR